MSLLLVTMICRRQATDIAVRIGQGFALLPGLRDCWRAIWSGSLSRSWSTAVGAQEDRVTDIGSIDQGLDTRLQGS